MKAKLFLTTLSLVLFFKVNLFSQVYLQGHVNGTPGIYEYNPDLQIGGGNPALLFASSSTYQGICRYSGTTSGILTNNRFFSVNISSNKIAYYSNGNWVTTNFSVPISAINMGGGGGFLYFKANGGAVTKFNGISSPTTLNLTNLPQGVTLSTYTSGDIIVDNIGNFYLMRNGFLDAFNSNGVFQFSLSLIGLPNGSVPAFAFYNNKIYIMNNLTVWEGIISGTEVNFSVIQNNNFVLTGDAGNNSFSPISNGQFLIGFKDVTNSVVVCNGGLGTTIGIFNSLTNVLPFSGPYNYQWQYKVTANIAFSDISNANMSTYTMQNSGYYRLRITSINNPNQIAFSNSFYYEILSSLPTPTIMSNINPPILNPNTPNVILQNTVPTPVGVEVMWFKTPNIISYFPAGNSLNVNQVGTYYARFYHLAKKDCQSTKSNQIYVGQMSGTSPNLRPNDNDDLKLTDIKIYPNPANNNFTIDGDFNTSSLAIYDLEGRKIAFTYLDDSHKNINTSNFTEGIYIIQYTLENGDVQSQKLIIKR